MTTKTTKTILVASMLTIIAFIPMQQHTFAIGDDLSQRVDEPEMVDFLNDMVKDTGRTVKTHALKDSSSVTITNDVQLLKENSYEVHSVVTYLGKVINDETIIITQNDDGTIKMVNEKQGFNVVFSKSGKSVLENGLRKISVSYTPIMPQPFGSGSSDVSGARVDLYDSGYKATAAELLYLEDSYVQCGGLRDYTTNATVQGTDYSTTAYWDSDQFYFHWCIMGHDVDHGVIYFQGNTYNWSGSYNRASSHVFSHGSNTGTFTLEADTYYGNW